MKETKWKVLKDLPQYEKGEIVSESVIRNNLNIKCPDGYPKWFEKVEENKIKVGSWVKHQNWDVLFRVESIEDDMNYSAKLSPISIHIGNNYEAEELLNHMCLDLSRLATTEEILAHLSAEALFRGFKSGVKLRGIFTNSEFLIRGNIQFEYNITKNILLLWSDKCESQHIMTDKGFIIIYDNGKWAEIIKETKCIPYDDCQPLLGTSIKVKENPSGIYLVTAATKNGIKINRTIEKDNWISARRLLDEYTFSDGSSCGQLRKEN